MSAKTIKINLNETTHALANTSLLGELSCHYRYLDPEPDLSLYKGFDPLKKYSELVSLAATKAPLLIRPMERIAGAATMREGAEHRFFDMTSISHTTLDFATPLKTGLSGMEKRILERLKTTDDKGRAFLESALSCVNSLRTWNKRYIDALEERIQESEGDTLRCYQEVRSNMAHVPEYPASTFHEALQSLWTLYAFLRLLGNWSGLGRIDRILGPYLEADLKAGILTLDEAREILSHFFIRGTEWTGLFDSEHWGGSGDKQYYQNILIGGIVADGHEVTNEVSYLVLDIIEELGISDFPVSVRLNHNSPERLIRRTAEVIRKGGGIVAWYDESRVIEALVKLGIPLNDAREFTNDGCWEAIIGGKSAFGYYPFDMLAHFQTSLQESAEHNDDFEALYNRFFSRIRQEIENHAKTHTSWFMNEAQPTPFLSLFIDGCLEKARQYTEKGARYTIYAIHAGGMPDTANALTAVKQLVFVEKRLSLSELARIVRENWDGHESLRQEIQATLPRYGNDLDSADSLFVRLFDDFTKTAAQFRSTNDVLLPAGLSTFGRQLEWRENRTATPDGFKKGAVLSGNYSPVPGTAKRGPTAILLSAGKLNYTRLPNGCALDLSFEPGLLAGEEGLRALCSLIQGSLRTGIFLVQVNVVDPGSLRQAQAHPEQFPELTVRVSGWSARFVSLNRQWQDMVIARLEQDGRCAPPPIRIQVPEVV